MSRNHQYLDVHPPSFELADEFHAAHARHLQIGHHHVERTPAKLRQRLNRTRAGVHFVLRRAQHVRDRFSRLRVVVNDQHAIALLLGWLAAHAAARIVRRGMRIVKAAPPSGQLVAVTVPPCASAT